MSKETEMKWNTSKLQVPYQREILEPILQQYGIENITFKQGIAKDHIFEAENINVENLRISDLNLISNLDVVEIVEANNTAYLFLQNLKYFSERPELPPYKKQIRIREETLNGKTEISLTAKRKNTLNGIERNLEGECLPLSPYETVQKLVESLGYVEQISKNKTKTKHAKVSGTYQGNEINVEFISIQEIPNQTFLEIEILTDENQTGVEKIITELAANMGIKSPELTVDQGGYLEPKGYQILQIQIASS